jgi:hypothetical protein
MVKKSVTFFFFKLSTDLKLASNSAFFHTLTKMLFETKHIFLFILALLVNFEAYRAQNCSKTKSLKKNVNQDELYFPILIPDQQCVKNVHPNGHCGVLIPTKNVSGT